VAFALLASLPLGPPGRSDETAQPWFEISAGVRIERGRDVNVG